MKELFSPLVTIIAVLVGGLVQYLFFRLSEKWKSYDKLRTDSYVDFVKGCTGVAIAQRFQNKTEELKATSLMADAKTRIAIYGDPTIVRLVGEFFAKYGDFSKREDMQAFVDLIYQIRRQVTGKTSDSDWLAISQILFSDDVRIECEP